MILMCIFLTEPPCWDQNEEGPYSFDWEGNASSWGRSILYMDEPFRDICHTTIIVSQISLILEKIFLRN